MLQAIGIQFIEAHVVSLCAALAVDTYEPLNN